MTNMTNTKKNTIDTNEKKTCFYYDGKFFHDLLIDTCALMHWNFESAVKSIIPALQMGSVKILVLWSVKHELERFANANENSDRKKRAQRALQNLNALYSAGMVRYVGDPNGKVGDKGILEYVFKSRARNEKLLLITQDHILAQDIIQINKLGSAAAPWANVLRIDSKESALVKFDFSASKVPAKAQEKNDLQLKAVLARFGL